MRSDSVSITQESLASLTSSIASSPAQVGQGAAHSRYNAILERVASFARAAELAQRS